MISVEVDSSPVLVVVLLFGILIDKLLMVTVVGEIISSLALGALDWILNCE